MTAYKSRLSACYELDERETFVDNSLATDTVPQPSPLTLNAQQQNTTTTAAKTAAATTSNTASASSATTCVTPTTCNHFFTATIFSHEYLSISKPCLLVLSSTFLPINISGKNCLSCTFIALFKAKLLRVNNNATVNIGNSSSMVGNSQQCNTSRKQCTW